MYFLLAVFVSISFIVCSRMRGAVMFVTVLLIGAGWVFIKHVFTDREKKLFLIVLPLQVSILSMNGLQLV